MNIAKTFKNSSRGVFLEKNVTVDVRTATSLKMRVIFHCVKSVRIRCYSGPHFSRIFSDSD